MEIRVLRYFLEVAREGNITRAAAYLHISQPTLSRQLKELEEELGKKLFVRSNYSVRLTEEGMLLRKRAEDILDMVDKTAREFKSLDEINGGDIHIGCAESEGMDCFLQAVKALRARYPRIRVHLYSSASDAVEERLDRGLLDFAVVAQEIDPARYNGLRLPHDDRWGVLLPREDPLAAREAIEIGDLLGPPLICSRQSRESEMPGWFGDHLAEANFVGTYDLLYNASLMARAGIGYVLGFDRLVDTGPESPLCFRPLRPALTSPLYLIWRKYQAFTPVAKLLLEELRRLYPA